MTVLVTGGAGFIGSHIVDRLIERGHDVAVLDNFSTGRPELVNPRAAVYRCDLRSERLAGVVARTGAKLVVHAAAQASVHHSLADPIQDSNVNVLGTVRLLRACVASTVERLVYISTGGAAYGDTSVVPTPEDHPLRPASPYGVSKVSAEHYVDCFGKLGCMRTSTLRLSNVYGPRQSPAGEAGVVTIFSNRLARGEQCVIYGDGEQTRDFVYVGDVAAAVVNALERTDVVGPINIGTGTETTINALYELLAMTMESRQPALHLPPRFGEQRRSALLPLRARRVLAWQPITSLDSGLAATVGTLGRRAAV